ncbi:MAG: ferric reductase-like transmembrane domain-containing protein [Anaerolineae bacterium]
MNIKSHWLDGASLVFSVVVIGVALILMIQQGFFSANLLQDTNLSWHLIRSAGTVAYVLLTTSVLWGLALSSRVVKDWSPGVLSMVMHSTLSWLAVILAAGHALLLLVDSYFHYSLSDVVIPFTGPYRPFAVGLGTLALWVSFAVAISFAFKDRMGHRAWKLLHYTSYITFAMATVHGLLAGKDASLLGFKLLIAFCVVAVVVFTTHRINLALEKEAAPRPVAAKSRRSR